jgi:hypothetical protein
MSGGWDVAEMADWVELCASVSPPFLLGTLQSGLARSDELTGDPASVSGQVWEEVLRRSVLCPAAWPLRVRGGRLVAIPGHANTLWHYFLCSISLGVSVTPEGRRLFEHAVAEVMPALTGRRAFRLGWPRSAGMPSGLNEAVDLYVRLSLEDRTGELFVSTDKDFGLDVVSWRQFQDARGAFLPFIGQCATGKNWYEEGKADELQLSRWGRYVLWAVKPVRFFAVPFVVLPHQWIRAANSAGLILDRPRLLELALSCPLSRRRRAAIYAYSLLQSLELAA